MKTMLLRTFMLVALVTMIRATIVFAQGALAAGPDSDSEGKISLQFKNMNIIEVLRTLSERSDLNIVASSGVKGNITVFLDDVTAKEALDIIVNLNNLAYVQEAKTIMVFTEQEYQSLYNRKFRDQPRMKTFTFKHVLVGQVASQLASLKTKDGYVIADPRTNTLIVVDILSALKAFTNAIEVLDRPVETRVFQLEYSSASDVKELISPLLGSGANIIVDATANRLIVTDASASLERAAAIVSQYDTPKSTITKAFQLKYAAVKDLLPVITSHLGQNSGRISSDEKTNTILVTDLPAVVQQIEAVIDVFDRKPLEVRIEAKILQISLDAGSKMGVDWEAVTNEFQDVTDLTGKARFRILGESEDGLVITGGDLEKDKYTALIEMLATQGKTDLLSAPQLVVLNNTEARILVGSTVPYKTIDTREQNGSLRTFEKVTMIDVGVKLYVTPTINSDSMIIMAIRPEVSSVTGYSDNIPIVEKAETSTTVMVKDGVTVLIGGLVREEMRESIRGVPILSRIPILGMLFRSKTSQKVKSEMAILITPYIIDGGITTPEAQEKAATEVFKK